MRAIPTTAPTWRRKSQRSCGARSPATTRSARSRPGCTAIALNVAISFVRSDSHRQRHAVPLDDALHDVADGNAADPETDEQVRALHGFIARLDPLNRALLLLYLEERSQREIADILGITETNVSTKISRLKQRIRDDLAA